MTTIAAEIQVTADRKRVARLVAAGSMLFSLLIVGVATLLAVVA